MDADEISMPWEKSPLVGDIFSASGADWDRRTLAACRTVEWM